MANILDTSPYPLHEPDAVTLHRTLYSLVPRSQRAVYFAGAVGINIGLVNWEEPAFDFWLELLKTAAVAKKTRALVKALRADPSLESGYPLFDALLADQSPLADREPAGSGFLKKNDQISEPEALLFHDDLTLSTGRLEWLAGVLAAMQKLSPAVCRLEVVSNNDAQSGTGFRIGGDLLLTNWHVIYLDGNAPTAITAEFGYELDATGAALTATTIPCEIAPVCADTEGDWGVLRVSMALDPTVPKIDLTQAADPVEQAPAFIIQHPGGSRKRVAYVRNQITYFDDLVVHYLSDTQVGSLRARRYSTSMAVLSRCTTKEVVRRRSRAGCRSRK